jgi:hypothetical protein
MTSNEKSLNYQVADLVERYKFRIKFISIRVHTKKLQFFLKQNHNNRHGPRRLQVLHTNRRSPQRFDTVAPTTVMAHGGRW